MKRKLDLINEEIVYEEFFKVYEAQLRFEQFNGSMSNEVTRYSFYKSDAVAVLVYHTTKDAYILVRQFRYPPVHHNVDPWLIEIVAGGIEKGEEPENSAAREVKEEIGYYPLRMEKITTCYVSPGMMSERVTIFLAEVNDDNKISKGGGAKAEDEDIEMVWIPRADALNWLTSQTVGDAKTIIALQWHLNRK